MEYILDDKKFGFSYQEIKEQYEEFCNLTDEQFINRIAEVLHLACFICWIKEIPSSKCLSDIGIIHELIHLIDLRGEPLVDLQEIRELFKTSLKLV